MIYGKRVALLFFFVAFFFEKESVEFRVARRFAELTAEILRFIAENIDGFAGWGYNVNKGREGDCMNYLIYKKIEEYEKATNPSEKVIKINYALEFIIMYFSCVFFFKTKIQNIINQDIIETIYKKFYKQNPLLSSWIKLLKASYSLLKYNVRNFSLKEGKNIQIIAKSFLPESTKKEIIENPDLFTVLDSVSVIRSKAFAHSNALSEETVSNMLSNGFSELPYKLNDFLCLYDESKLMLADTIEQCFDIENDSKHIFLDLSSNIQKSISLSSTEINCIDSLSSKTLYLYDVVTSVYISLFPFFIFRDKTYLYYNGVDNKSAPVYYDIFNSSKNIVIKKYETAFKDLISEELPSISTSEIPIKIKTENGITHNLPTPMFNKFIGRSESREKIIHALENRRMYLISISGIGGIGKTALALKTASDIIQSKKGKYTYILWASAKKTYLTTDGLKEEQQTFTDLIQLFDLLLKITGFSHELKLSYNAKKEFCIELLSIDNFLIFIDNFETIQNPKEFIDFFEKVADKCENTKIIITTRHQLGTSEKIIDIKEFGDLEYMEFVRYLTEEKFKISSHLSEKQIKKLKIFTGGLPLATEYIIGQINSNNSISTILERIEERKITKDDILSFSYDESFSLLKPSEKRVLFAIGIIDKPNTDNLAYTCDFDEFDIEEIIDRLKNLSFINEVYEFNETSYTILPLTKIFLNKMLEKFHEQEQELKTKYEEYLYISNFSSLEFESKAIFDAKNISSKFAIAAYNAAKQGDFTKSEEYFNKAINFNEHDGSLWYYKALAERDFSHNVDDKYFKKAINYSSTTEQESIYYEWAKSLLNLNKNHEAIEKLKNLINLNQTNMSAWHLIGKTYYEIGKHLYTKQHFFEMREQYKQAKDAFEKCIYINPQTEFEKNHNAVSYFFLARLSRYMNQIDQAIKYIKKGLEIQPSNYKLQDYYDNLLYLENRE